MLKYILGLLKNLFNPAVSLFNKIDNASEIDHRSKIYSGCQVTHSKMGRYSYLGRKSRLIYTEVGDFCSIAGGAVIGMGTHTLKNISTSSIFTEKNNGTKHSWIEESVVEQPFEKVIIGSDVWIGSDVMVLGGVTIGNGAIIGARALVTKDIPPFAIVGGVPAKIIRYRFPEEQVRKLEDLKWWTWSEEKLKANLSLFQKEFDINILEHLSQLK